MVEDFVSGLSLNLFNWLMDKLLLEVLKHQDENKMTSKNLGSFRILFLCPPGNTDGLFFVIQTSNSAIVWAPALFGGHEIDKDFFTTMSLSQKGVLLLSKKLDDRYSEKYTDAILRKDLLIRSISLYSHLTSPPSDSGDGADSSSSSSSSKGNRGSNLSNSASLLSGKGLLHAGDQPILVAVERKSRRWSLEKEHCTPGRPLSQLTEGITSKIDALDIFQNSSIELSERHKFDRNKRAARLITGSLSERLNELIQIEKVDGNGEILNQLASSS